MPCMPPVGTTPIDSLNPDLGTSTPVLLFFLHAMGAPCDCRNIEAYLLKPAAGDLLRPAWRFSILLRFCAWHIRTCSWYAESCDLGEKRLMCLTIYRGSP